MRMRLGILHDADAQQRMHDRELKAAEEKKRKAETPIVRTEEEQLMYDAQKAQEEQDAKDGKVKEDKVSTRPKIKPLSEARAIELGANFFSEAFIFGVAVGLLMIEAWRSRRKESARRDDVADRLEQLELEVEGLRSRLDPDLEDEKALIDKVREARTKRTWSWWNPVSWVRGEEDTAIMEEERDVGRQPEKEKPLVAQHKPSKDVTSTTPEDDLDEAAARREERRAEKRKADIEKVLADRKQAAAAIKKREAAEKLKSEAERESPPEAERIDTVDATRKER